MSKQSPKQLKYFSLFTQFSGSSLEVNEIDFKKLPSQAAITRGMSVIDQEFDGMKVEFCQ
ncbi:hypothetical protein ACJ6HK_06695 [Acinetobacter baumannii]|uniref:hypothetical protein n=1 Tax=Acinetobacter baumannii TaxID=470 RepID=UPI00396F29A7